MIKLLFSLLLFLPCRTLSASGRASHKLNAGQGASMPKQKGGAKGVPAAARTEAEPPPPPQVFCVLGGRSGKPFGDLASFKSVIWKSDIVYAGGADGRAESLRLRLEALKAMREAHGSKVAVGFEAVAVPLQPVLDNFAAGKISEEEFLQRSGWNQGPGADFALYRPLFDFIILNKFRALALGLPERMVRRTELEGPAGLTAEDKALLPAAVAVSAHKKYLGFLKNSFNGAGPAAWENHLTAVSYMNESSGARIADFLNANPGWAMLVAAGNDRLVYNAAIPASVRSRMPGIRQATFYAEDAARCPETLPKERRDLANYIWYSTAAASGGK